MTTPEQLAKYKEEFGKTYAIPSEFIDSAITDSRGIGQHWQGYLRAKQETEQAMKLAKFGAMVLSTSMSAAAGIGIDAGVLVTKAPSSEANLFDIEYAPNIEATIKELLK